MAGHHQIWTLDLAKEQIAPYAGTGRENIRDGALRDGVLRPAERPDHRRQDAVRGRQRGQRRPGRAAGRQGRRSRRSSANGRLCSSSATWTASATRCACSTPWASPTTTASFTWPTPTTARSRCIDPEKRSCKTLLGGEPDGWLAAPLFNEPGGLSFADGKLYVADTNAHRIRVVDLKRRKCPR